MDKPVIGVIGLGAMGLGIAQVYAQAGFPVLATDVVAPTRENARTKLEAQLDQRVASGKLTAEARNAILARLTVAEGLPDFRNAELVIEAIVERLESKRSLFSDLEAIVAPQSILATNTSSLPVAHIAAGLRHGERVLGLHFFNPPTAMRLVEMVAHHGTAAEIIAKARSLTEEAGKTVIACPDLPGFIVNRCARPFYGEALAMLEEGRSAMEIDAAILQAGYRMGPFSLIDLIGADVHQAATEGVFSAMNRHPRYRVFETLRKQVESGQLGRKSGKGFVFPGTPSTAPRDARDIVLRIEATLANEAASLMQDSGLDEASIDTAMKLGLNFPRGPFESARRHGLAPIRDTLRSLERTAPSHLAGRYALVPALEKLA